MLKHYSFAAPAYLSFRKRVFLLMLLLSSFTACQPDGQAETQATTAEERQQQNTIDSTRLAARRPAPEFYILTPENHKTRVYICDDPYSDVFHTKYDCEVLSQCDATKKNVTLLNAIREYGRYNCTTCSSELAHIFDEKMVR